MAISIVETAGSATANSYVTLAQAQAFIDGLVENEDVLAFEDVVSFKHAYIYHPIGLKWAVTTTNPTRAQLETATNWEKVYAIKNIGIVRANVTSPLD